jgi:hypothetical protein
MELCRQGGERFDACGRSMRQDVAIQATVEVVG